ncbi:MAG: hypothetical protein LBK53_04050 [Heliobacteriaceae bacterium]|nr:hypothetical protein [Heliobacteriaceae bacterium]
MINLLSYTKKISEKIRFYDALLKKTAANPFAKPVNITIVWVEEDNCKDNE